MLPYGRQSVDEHDVAAVVEVLGSDWLTTGPWVRAFESAIAALAGTPGAISVTSGTAALHTAYAAIGVGAGDEVVSTPLTFVATASCATILGATVVFADVTADTGNLDPDAVAAATTSRTRVVAGVDYGGHPIDVTGLRSALGGRRRCSWRTRRTRSAGPSTAARWGPLPTSRPSPSSRRRTSPPPRAGRSSPLTRRCCPERHLPQHRHGQGPRCHAGGRRGCVVLRGARGRGQLPAARRARRAGLEPAGRLESFSRRRREIHARYTEGLRDLDALALPPTRVGADPTWHLYSLRVRDGRRRALFEHLRENGIGVQVNYIPVYWHPLYADLGYRRGMCPVAEGYYEQEISLPLFPDLADGDVDRVIELVRGFVGG